MTRLLIADDHDGTREGLCLALEELGHSVHLATNGEEAIDRVKQYSFDLAIVDVKMPKKSRIEVLESIVATSPETSVVMMTAFGTIEFAVEAMQKGAADFITKPYKLEQIEIKIEQTLERRRLSQENTYLRQEEALRYSFDEILGQSPKMQAVFHRIRTVAPTNSTVLIEGESGTGKELIARAVHQNSKRSSKPFVKVNCAALAEGLLESELFGHEKGAFTNAIKQKAGRFEIADTGTLFLDEIGELSPATQVKLLRVLQEREFERVGGTRTISVDVRLVAATNRNLPARIAEGAFREDLYYRLNVVPIEVPPVRDRREDIPLLVAHFLFKYNAEIGKKISEIHPSAMDLLTSHPWFGNVRELENAIERAVVLAEGDTITANDLALSPPSPDDRRATELTTASESDGTFPELVEAFEKQLLRDAYLKANRVKADAAKMLGIERTTFRYKFDKYRLGFLDECS